MLISLLIEFSKRYFQRFWNASSDFSQSQWDKIAYAFGYDKFNIIVYGSFILTSSVYWIIGLLYTLIDLMKPAFLIKYKIQDNSPPVSFHYSNI